MRNRLALPKREPVNPMFVLMDVSFSLMFAMAIFACPDAEPIIELPPSRWIEASVAPAANTEQRPVVRIDATGAVTVNDQPASLDEVIAAVRGATSAESLRTKRDEVRLEAHRKVEYGQVSRVREDLQLAGFDVIEIAQLSSDPKGE